MKELIIMNEKPINILLIHADQHRCDCIGAYGNSEIQTPNIDKIANDGVLYKNSFCTFPVCTPSRYSLLSGLYVHQHMGWSNHCTLPAAIETFPRILRNNGYNTKAVGKMHFTPTYSDVGFEEMELAEQDGPGRYDDDYHRYLMENDLNDKIDLIDQVKEYRKDAPPGYWETFGAQESLLEEKSHSTTWIGDRAFEAINNWGDSNNMLMVGFIKPHHPFDPPAEWSDLYNPEDLSLLPGWTEKHLPYDIEKSKGYFPHEDLTEEKLRRVTAYYYALISQIDFQIGRMIDLLKSKNMYDNTMIIYTSDHGEYLGYHHLLLKGNFMYDPLMKVPLIIKYPYQQHAGTQNNMLISNIDIGPTILGQVNIAVGKYMSGYDVSRNIDEREYIFGESGYGENYMVRSSLHKLLLCKKDEKSQFFDLEKDKYELNNLYNNPDYKDLINEYKSRLNRWILFETPTPIYTDEYGAIIDKANAVKYNSGHRKIVKEYFQNKMKSDV